MFIWILCLVLLFALIGAAPAWPHSRRWGYRPIGIVTLFLIIFLFVWMFGGFSTWGHHAWWGGGHTQGDSMMGQ
jgi:NhaP-type Na+/H+ or K+/H+ antiporter